MIKLGTLGVVILSWPLPMGPLAQQDLAHMKYPLQIAENHFF